MLHLEDLAMQAGNVLAALCSYQPQMYQKLYSVFNAKRRLILLNSIRASPEQ